MAEAIPLRTLDIDWADLEIAFRDNVSGVKSYLDLETGEVVAIIDERDLDADSVAREPERFEDIPGFTREEGLEVLHAFVDELPPGEQRDELRSLVGQPGALARCMERLAADVHLFNNYCMFEELCIYERLMLWLAAMGVNARHPPPAGPTLFLISSPAAV